MGMLIEPEVLMGDPERVAAIAAAIVIGKLVLTALPVVLHRYPVRIAVLVGLTLAHAGEFSFVLARVGVEEGVNCRYRGDRSSRQSPQTVRRRQWLFRKVTAPYNASQAAPQQMFRRRAGAEAK